jgi:hypothetical protein
VIEQRIRPLLDQPLAQARAVAAGIGGGVGHFGCVKCGRGDSNKASVDTSVKPAAIPAFAGMVDRKLSAGSGDSVHETNPLALGCASGPLRKPWQHREIYRNRHG